MAAKALGGWGAEVAYELGWRLGGAEHSEIFVAVEHAVELLADQLLPEGPRFFLHPGVEDTGVDARYGDPVRFAFEGEDTRELIQGPTPLFAIDAPTAGTGK